MRACVTSSARVRTSHSAQRRCSLAVPVVVGKRGGERPLPSNIVGRLDTEEAMRFAQVADKKFLLKLTATAAVEEVVGRVHGGPLGGDFDSRLLCEVTS